MSKLLYVSLIFPGQVALLPLATHYCFAFCFFLPLFFSVVLFSPSLLLPCYHSSSLSILSSNHTPPPMIIFTFVTLCAAGPSRGPEASPRGYHLRSSLINLFGDWRLASAGSCFVQRPYCRILHRQELAHAHGYSLQATRWCSLGPARGTGVPPNRQSVGRIEEITTTQDSRAYGQKATRRIDSQERANPSNVVSKVLPRPPNKRVPTCAIASQRQPNHGKARPG